MTEAPTGPALDGYRSGFVSFVGRPNAGKSTLTEALALRAQLTARRPSPTR